MLKLLIPSFQEKPLSFSSILTVPQTDAGRINCEAGNTAIFTKGGTVTITASQLGDANYNAASDVSVSFPVLKIPMATMTVME